MPLDDYRAKRDFHKTPEPRGRGAKRRNDGKLFFCVQKHLATQLHYDLRLEHEGVLLSWAVPKGPSLDPKVKRLAMQVEDHPLEYGTFEGVIPEGYGAGVVMLWDKGTWEPEGGDVATALGKGDLKLRLDGYKLKGSWVLVRTRGGESRSWLLMKHRDEWAGEVDITELAPHSVKSGQNFTGILSAEAPATWLSDREGGGDMVSSLTRIFQRVAALEHHGATPPGEAPASRSRKARETPTVSSRQSATGRNRARKAGPSAAKTTVSGRTGEPSRGRTVTGRTTGSGRVRRRAPAKKR
jgi:bifunctional non-homologous end joining protein LigD